MKPRLLFHFYSAFVFFSTCIYEDFLNSRKSLNKYFQTLYTFLGGSKYQTSSDVVYPQFKSRNKHSSTLGLKDGGILLGCIQWRDAAFALRFVRRAFAGKVQITQNKFFFVQRGWRKNGAKGPLGSTPVQGSWRVPWALWGYARPPKCGRGSGNLDTLGPCLAPSSSWGMSPGGRRPGHPSPASGLVNRWAGHLLQGLVARPQSCSCACVSVIFITSNAYHAYHNCHHAYHKILTWGTPSLLTGVAHGGWDGQIISRTKHTYVKVILRTNHIASYMLIF